MSCGEDPVDESSGIEEPEKSDVNAFTPTFTLYESIDGYGTDTMSNVKMNTSFLSTDASMCQNGNCDKREWVNQLIMCINGVAYYMLQINSRPSMAPAFSTNGKILLCKEVDK